MALQKEKLVKNFACDYHRIVQLNMNFDRPDSVVTLSLYKDKESREADVTAVVDSFQIDLANDFIQSTGKEDKIKNINLSKAYELIVERAKVEQAKIDAYEAAEDKEGLENGDADLAFFADAVKI